MTPEKNNQSFFDGKTILAFVLVMAFWFGWKEYMERKYPPAPATQGAQQKPQANAPTPVAPTAENPAAPVSPTAPSVLPESIVTFEDAKWSFNLSSKGMGLKDVVLKSYKDRKGKPIVLGRVEDKLPFSTVLVGQNAPVDFQIEKTGEKTFLGRGTLGNLVIEKNVTVDSDRYSLSVETTVKNAGDDFKGIMTYLSDVLEEPKKGGFLAPSYDHQEFFLVHEGTKTRNMIDVEKGLNHQEKNISSAALSSHYFALGLVDKSDLMPRFETAVPGKSQVAVGALVYQPVSKSDTFTVKQLAFAGPKDFHVLKSVDGGMVGVIDYGTFGWIAKPLLSLMKFFYSVFKNWGLAIIALTILVRILVLPFNIYSFRSMKSMQVIQPKMQKLREKYKDDPQTMNREVMALMKEHKANPLGGCLPMFLQLPVFIALYQVLGQSIELYQAPFMLWIHDLSVKDPYFVLPVLMGASMFVQQKITPTTMDPQQAKVMMFLPVVFSLMMISLPSGLTLYIFVSTLFGIIQQYVLMREKSPNTSVSKAQA